MVELEGNLNTGCPLDGGERKKAALPKLGTPVNMRAMVTGLRDQTQ